MESVTWRAPKPCIRWSVSALYCRFDRIPVVERLAHAHENDIAKVRIVSFSNNALCPPDLHENFGDWRVDASCPSRRSCRTGTVDCSPLGLRDAECRGQRWDQNGLNSGLVIEPGTAFKVPSSASSMCSSGGGSNTQRSLNTRSVFTKFRRFSWVFPRRSARIIAAARPGPPICSTRDSNPSSSNLALLGFAHVVFIDLSAITRSATRSLMGSESGLAFASC